MSTTTIFLVITGYFALLMLVAKLTSGKGDSNTFFQANKQSPWFLVAFGMIGATLSGVTFISVPGEVGNSGFRYLQFVLGNLVGYWVIAFGLLPLYYKLKLVSIYSFLGDRFGPKAHVTGSYFFILSKIVGAAFRLYLVAGVLQIAFFDRLNIPFFVTVFISIVLIWLYTNNGGIKTIVWTDALQTFFILLTVGITIYIISQKLQWTPSTIFDKINADTKSIIFDWNWNSKHFFWKQFVAGIFMTIAMNGFDQDIMQKNLTCKSPSEARKNMLWFSLVFVIAVVFFLSLGVMLYQYANNIQLTIPTKTDDLYPLLAINHLGVFAGIIFLIGITAAAYSSADSALTSLTTSYCVDVAHIENIQPEKQKQFRKRVHIIFSLILFFTIIIFRSLNNDSIVIALFKFAGYTYGPLLGIFAIGLLTKAKVKDQCIPWICVASPLLTYLLVFLVEKFGSGYQFGFELLLINGAITSIGLLLCSKR
ncbi:sodium:solute symporter [Prolixibacteraceae bacterium JC049]|nr:sodium:solute symporter [Prolixibacteraceae bacterium JC049]